MAIIGTQLKSRKQQRLDAELGVIIDEMERAMWAANKKYLAERHIALTSHMQETLGLFLAFCEKNYGK